MPASRSSRRTRRSRSVTVFSGRRTRSISFASVVPWSGARADHRAPCLPRRSCPYSVTARRSHGPSRGSRIGIDESRWSRKKNLTPVPIRQERADGCRRAVAHRRQSQDRLAWIADSPSTFWYRNLIRCWPRAPTGTVLDGFVPVGVMVTHSSVGRWLDFSAFGVDFLISRAVTWRSSSSSCRKPRNWPTSARSACTSAAC